MRFLMIMIPEVCRKPVPPDFVPDLGAMWKMGGVQRANAQGRSLAGSPRTDPSRGRCQGVTRRR